MFQLTTPIRVIIWLHLFFYSYPIPLDFTVPIISAKCNPLLGTSPGPSLGHSLTCYSSHHSWTSKPCLQARLKGHLVHNDYLLPSLTHSENSFLLPFLPLSLHQTLCFLLMTIDNSVIGFGHYTLAVHYLIETFLRIETIFFWLFLLIATIKANKW